VPLTHQSTVTKNNTIFIDWFQKKTFSGRTLSYFSNHPFCHKKGIIYNFIFDRSLLLSHSKFHEKNISLIINILHNNGYLLDLIFSTINQRLKHLIVTKLNISSNNNILTQFTDTDDMREDKKFFVIPYINGISDRIASVINKSEMTMGYRCLNKFSKIIKVHKDKNQLTSNSNVIYKISCMIAMLHTLAKRNGNLLRELKNMRIT